ncbi:MAG: hypothetical protein ABSF46_03810 [Terriglobia bacterium]|jgi:hypothetical protein
MLMVMRLDAIILEQSKRLRVGAWLLALGLGVATSAAGFMRQPAPRFFQESGQQAQAREQAPGEAQNPSNQTSQQEPAKVETEPPDDTLAGIRAALQNVSSPDLGALGRAFDTTVTKQHEALAKSSAIELNELGDLDGDGVPEVVMKVPGVGERQSDVQSPASPSSWLGFYLLSWDGAHWKVSSLAASGQHSEFRVVQLGKGVAPAIAVVNVIGDDALPYPAVFRVRQHEADLLWDSQVGDNRFNPLVHGQIEFQDDPKLDQTVMIETGRADPGLLEFEPGGRRGFGARCVYHWDGEAYVPVQTDYSPGPDNSLYRFIAALHLHDFRSAYALIDAGKFLKTDTPSLEQFRHVIETHWREFLDDQVFQAREATTGSPDALAFELPDQHYVYRPTLSDDGKFLLTGLERTVEMPGTEESGDSP